MHQIKVFMRTSIARLSTAAIVVDRKTNAAFTSAPGHRDDLLLFSSYVLRYFMRIFCFCCRRIPLVVKQKAFLFHPANLPPTFSSSKTSVSVCFYDFLRSFVSLFYFIFIVAFVISYFMIHLTAKKNATTASKELHLEEALQPVSVLVYFSRKESMENIFLDFVFRLVFLSSLSRVFMFEEILLKNKNKICVR